MGRLVDFVHRDGKHRTPSSVTVPAGGGVEIATAASSTNTSFAANTGTLKLDDSQHYTGTVAGLVGQDSLDLADIKFIIGTPPRR